MLAPELEAWRNDAVLVQLVVDGVPHPRARLAGRLLKELLLAVPLGLQVLEGLHEDGAEEAPRRCC